MFAAEPILLMFGAVLFLYFIAVSIKFPMILAAIYPLTFLSFTQTAFSVGGVSPSKYLGAVLIFVGLIYLAKEIGSSADRNYSLLGLFCLIMFFPMWILIRFLIEGSDLNLAFTFLLNALTTFSIVVMINTERRKRIIEISLGATFIILALSMIIAYYFPSITMFRTTQLGGYSRTLGLVNDPNYGGAFIAIGITYFFSKLVYYYETKRRSLFYLFLFLMVISLIGLGMTLSRSAILSAAACLLMMFLFGRMKFKNLVWFSLLIMFLYMLARQFPSLVDDMISRFSILTFDFSNTMRLEIFKHGIHVFENNLWVGVGQFTGYHNAFLDAAVFGGVIGLISFVLIILIVFVTNIKIMISSEQMFREAARFVVFGLFVIVFNSMLIGMETERIVWFVFGWGIINFILYRKAHQDVKTTARTGPATGSELKTSRFAL
ncbi:MAG TPA: O-antigen ligase family protein [Anaerolineales bacterium]|nr:O-antigen ligase family protein [Anaerolineales bacterium]